MKIRYHKRFEKQFKKLPPSLKQRVVIIIERFISNPFDPRLHNHGLTGQLKGLRAINVTDDVRIIFEEYDHCMLVVFLDIGGHNLVYK